MKLLAVDIGTGTQDILLLDTAQAVENAIKMVLPSPTHIVAGRMERASRRGRPLLLTGATMGGGPSSTALKQHLALGLPVYATPEAARTFDDDLEMVRGWGVTIVGTDEAAQLNDVDRVETRDLDLDAIRRALAAFDVEPHFDGLALAVLDHGEAPPGVSDRLFRFQHFRRVVEADNRITAFAYLPPELPPYLTRMLAVATTAAVDCPLVLLDTGPAAALGSLEDPEVARHQPEGVGLVNLGNMHTLAFYIRGEAILGLFEHHTGLLDAPALESHLGRFFHGELTHEEVFEHHGHGCLMLDSASRPGGDIFLAATGPQRGKLARTALHPYYATPHGDMMLTGCFGLVRAFARKVEAWREEIERALRPAT